MMRYNKNILKTIILSKNIITKVKLTIFKLTIIICKIIFKHIIIIYLQILNISNYIFIIFSYNNIKTKFLQITIRW